MTGLGQYQNHLFSSLTDAPSPQLLADISTTSQSDDEAMKRLAVYQNNYAHGMIQVLKDAYPVILRLVGDEFFGALALQYAQSTPPQQAAMQSYGKSFPEFLQSHPSCQELPFLADVARIEYYYIQCFHGRDIEPINLNHLLAEEESDLPNTRFIAHSNCYLLTSDYPALDIWYANLEEVVAELDLSELSASRVLLYRNNDYQVETVQLNDMAYRFCELLFQGNSIADAWEILQSETNHALADEDLNGMLTYFIGLGVFSGLTIN